MQLHEVKREHPGARKKIRIGRGGKRGTTSGRGTKGQRSRAGRRIRPGMRDFIQRLPKLRGFRNRPRESKRTKVVNLTALSKLSTVRITRDELTRAGLMPKAYRGPIKILGEGKMDRPVTVKGVSVSRSAREKIEQAGGRIEPAV